MNALERRRKGLAAELAGRMPPADKDAELGALAGIVHCPDQRDEILSKLDRKDFSDPAMGAMFAACVDLVRLKAPITSWSLEKRLKDMGLLEQAGGAVAVGDLWNQAALGSSGTWYAERVLGMSMQRQLLEACLHIIEDAHDSSYDKIGDVLDDAERRILAVAGRSGAGRGPRDAGEARDAAIDFMAAQAASDDPVTGISTGYRDLDRLTCGLQRSDLVIIAARPAMGKTAFALNLALNASDSGRRVAVFSLEMSAQQLACRMLAVKSGVPLGKIRSPRSMTEHDWRALCIAAGQLRGISIDDTPSIRPLDLRAHCRRMKSREGLDLVIVDYLQLMRASSRNIQSRELEISEISRALKALAKELDIPVIALSQLNRRLEERDDKRPVLSDLRESGAIEQDADVVMFIYRDDVYARGDSGPRLQDSVAEIIIGKQRSGPIGVAKLLYRSPCTAFANMWHDPEAMEES